MIKRFFIFMTSCFMLMFSFAACADIVEEPELVETVESGGISLPVILVGVLVVATAVLIRVFWKPNKTKQEEKGND